MRNTAYVKREVIKFFNSGSKTANALALHLGLSLLTATEIIREYSDILEKDGWEKTLGSKRAKYRMKDSVIEQIGFQMLGYEPVRPNPSLDRIFSEVTRTEGRGLFLKLSHASSEAEKAQIKIRFAEQVFDCYDQQIRLSHELSADSSERPYKKRKKNSQKNLKPKNQPTTNWGALTMCWGPAFNNSQVTDLMIKRTAEEEVRQLLRIFIPNMELKVKPPKSSKERFERFVCSGINNGQKAYHVSAFNRAMNAYTRQFIDQRMACETDEEEQALKIWLAEQAVDEYLEILVDRKASKIVREGASRRLRIQKRGRGQEANEPLRFDSMIKNWMNPNNITKPKKVKAKEPEKEVEYELL